ncbi:MULTISPECIES: YdeI family protein [unclassified Rhizobacter]|uniref:YdeI/OmpD-associated family protein n=1 Tax=unclassified Rhizobacter TaxID=2640088 RepID=UPI0006F258A8|nr:MULTISPECIES: YdeI/OmpD-associated family protein [unclassified Rhizobacter]KQU73439.1 bacteriocin-protection protein [Rhizobacter sp. Root29]KQV98624.1 bacteriocin-protection protein [Rhizobacter sp. Root1238]KRB04877.1 bacteriocin-protection protein [Rhizobacter sp. Root16D2]
MSKETRETKETKETTETPEGSARRFATVRGWETWLAKHHADADGVWLLISRPGAEKGSVSYAEALEVALCHGWIDGHKKGLDEHHWLQRFTPRRARSLWSKVNREKVAALTAQGRMQPAGQREIDRAKDDGRWDQAYDSMRTITVPPDLQAAFDAQPVAAAFFKTLNSTNRYAVLWRVQTAKKPETRERRIATLVAMLARHEKLHP